MFRKSVPQSKLKSLEVAKYHRKTYAETYAILYNDNSFKIQGKESREIYEYLRNTDEIGLANWLKELTTEEQERMKKFGYDI